MKKAKGTCWKYTNHPHRGTTWAAELDAGHALLCAYGQKTRRAAIAVANRMAALLGWKMTEPWSVVDGKKHL